MTISTAASRCRGLFTLEGAPEALNEMGALPQGCYGVQAPVPALALDFLTQPLDQRITFSRASGGTRVNSAGLIEVVPVNLQRYSEDFAQAGWSVTGATKTSTNNEAPFGFTSDAMLLTISGAVSTHIVDFPASTYASGLAYTVSGYFKAGTVTAFQLSFGFSTFGGTQCANFSLVGSGSVTLQTGGTAAISAIGGGWFRCAFTATSSASAADGPMVGFINGPTMGRRSSYDATALTDSIYVWGIQVELGSVATTYIPTTTAASGAPRFDYDPVTLAPMGLLIEEARTNLSPDGHAPNAMTAGSLPGGGGTYVGQLFARCLADGTNAAHFCTFPTLAAAPAVSTAHTLSVYFKMVSGTRVQITGSGNWTVDANAYININNGVVVGTGASASNAFCIHQGNGVYRAGFTCSTNGAPSAGTPLIICASSLDADTRLPINTSSDSWDCFGAQLEVGSFPTSYIPTTTAAVTRAADVTYMDGTRFSSWFNPTEGTLCASADTYARVLNQYPQICSVNGGASTDVIWQYFSSNNLISGNVVTASVNQGVLAISSTSLSAKTAQAYKANDHQIAVNGVLSGGDSLVSLPTVSQLDIGRITGGGWHLNGHIQRLTYFNKRLPDATLKALSA